MYTDCVSIIVIGAGLIGPRHASHVVNRPNARLYAIVDHSAKGPSVAESFGVPLYKNLTEMFEYCDAYNVKYPDAAIIATPNHTHVPLGLHLASKGVHLLVEKPLSPNASDSKTLIDYCNSVNVKLLVGHHRRFNPYIISTKENLSKLGQVIAVQGTWTLRKPDDYFEEKPWRSSKALGGGALLINLIHDLDNLQYLFGPVQRVYAELLLKQRASQLLEESYHEAVDEGAVLTLRFANGICGTFICSDNVTSPFLFEAGTGENPTVPFNETAAGFYRVFGSHGTLSVPDLQLYHQNQESSRSWLNPVQDEQLKMHHELRREVEEEEDQIMFGMPTPSPSPNMKDGNLLFNKSKNSLEKPKPFDLQLDHFVNLVLGKELVVKCSGEDALRALLCIEAVKQSIETGLPQVVPSIDDIDINHELMI